MANGDGPSKLRIVDTLLDAPRSSWLGRLRRRVRQLLCGHPAWNLMGAIPGFSPPVIRQRCVRCDHERTFEARANIGG